MYDLTVSWQVSGNTVISKVLGDSGQWPERFVLKTLLFLFTFLCVCVSIRNTYKNASGISLVCLLTALTL